MREHLIAFIKAVQQRIRTDVPDHLRHDFRLGNGDRGTLWFGYGYHDADKVLWWPSGGGDPQEKTTEEGVDLFLETYGLKE